MASQPVAVVCIGMAGSGKTTFMQRINSYLYSKREPAYVLNLDPAVRTVPFDCNIDIRDSIDYKEVMKQYNLGPNGGILTSLNLFATKIDQVMSILEKRCGVPSAATASAPAPAASATTSVASPSETARGQTQTVQSTESQPTSSSPIKHIIVDTPGQIEVFVWSASGQILLSALASTYPTVLAYIVDTPRTTSTATFMANMLYACSILYKTKLPMIIVFNKADVQDASFAKEWMTDFETFQAALRREEDEGVPGGSGNDPTQNHIPGFGAATAGGSGYMNSLLSSMSLVLEEFYAHLEVVGVSAMTGQGIGDFFDAVAIKAQEFDRDYKPELERRRQEVQQERASRREKEMNRLMNDLDVQSSGTRGAGTTAGKRKTRPKRPEPETISDMEDDTDEDEDERNEDEEEDEENDGEGIIEPDGEDRDEAAGDDNDDESSLARKYQQAMRQSAADADGDNQDVLSFERYIRRSQGRPGA